jgi:hypothetical protein
MTFDRDLERAVRVWIAHGSEQLPDPALDAALNEIARTPQRRAGWYARILAMLGTVATPFAAAGVATTATVIVALTFLSGDVIAPPRGVPTPSATPTAPPVQTADPIPSLEPPPGPITSVSGRFEAMFGTVEIAASGDGANVSGSMAVQMSTRRHFSVNLRCSRTDDTGMVLIGGPVTDSTHPEADEGQRVALAIQPGEPASAILWFEGRRRAANCPTFLERAPDDFSAWLVPIDGDLELSRSQGEDPSP